MDKHFVPSGKKQALMPTHAKTVWKKMLTNRWLYFLALPGICYFLIFKYAPMWGLLIAFKNYNPSIGFWSSKWVGFDNFAKFFSNPDFFVLFRNTFLIAIYNLAFFFPLPIILAFMLNEVNSSSLKRVIQTITYMPHFLSWVVISSICYVMLTTESGIIYDITYAITGKKLEFLTDPRFFRPIIVIQSVWRETGWGTIIFLAALTNVDPQLYDAANVDGANRWQRLRHITLPAISGVIVTLLILRLGRFLDTGFTQIFLMTNSLNRDVAEVFDTYVYRMGVQGGKYSYTTAVGMFKSVIGLVLVVVSDRISKRFGGDGIL